MLRPAKVTVTTRPLSPQSALSPGNHTTITSSQSGLLGDVVCVTGDKVCVHIYPQALQTVFLVHAPLLYQDTSSLSSLLLASLNYCLGPQQMGCSVLPGTHGPVVTGATIIPSRLEAPSSVRLLRKNYRVLFPPQSGGSHSPLVLTSGPRQPASLAHHSPDNQELGGTSRHHPLSQSSHGAGSSDRLLLSFLSPYGFREVGYIIPSREGLGVRCPLFFPSTG